MENLITYKVVGIFHHDGTPRIDGRYPKRINRLCHLVRNFIGGMTIFWITDENGEAYDGVLSTSKVVDDMTDKNTRYVTTLNSIYIFEVVDV